MRISWRLYFVEYTTKSIFKRFDDDACSTILLMLAAAAAVDDDHNQILKRKIFNIQHVQLSSTRLNAIHGKHISPFLSLSLSSSRCLRFYHAFHLDFRHFHFEESGKIRNS